MREIVNEQEEIIGYIPPNKMDMAPVPAHDQIESSRYIVHYPSHLPRKEDPFYSAFVAYHRATARTAKCFIGIRVGFKHCNGGLELHHAHVEYSLANGIDLKAIQVDFPDLTNEHEVQKWVESEHNFRWLCMFHHRGHAGVHVVSHAIWEAGQYVPGLVS